MTDLKKLSAEDLRNLQAQLNEENKRRVEEDRSKTLKLKAQGISNVTPAELAEALKGG